MADMPVDSWSGRHRLAARTYRELQKREADLTRNLKFLRRQLAFGGNEALQREVARSEARGFYGGVERVSEILSR